MTIHETETPVPSGLELGDGYAEPANACQDLLTCAVDYARQHPETAALWCFGVGFILGWKLKPW